MKSMAAAAVGAYRSGKRSPSREQGREQNREQELARLMRMALRSERFAPGVMLPGGTVATVMRFPDGSIARVSAEARVSPEASLATADAAQAGAATLTRPEDVAVATEALDGPAAVETAEWLKSLTGPGPVQVSPSLCAKCRAYRPPISRGEDGQIRLGPCPNRCWG